MIVFVTGVQNHASPREIKKAYYRKVWQTHPDRGGKELDFKRVQESWEILKDPVKRRELNFKNEGQSQTCTAPTYKSYKPEYEQKPLEPRFMRHGLFGCLVFIIGMSISLTMYRIVFLRKHRDMLEFNEKIIW